MLILATRVISQDSTYGRVTQVPGMDSIGRSNSLVVGILTYPNIMPLLYADDDVSAAGSNLMYGRKRLKSFDRYDHDQCCCAYKQFGYL